MAATRHPHGRPYLRRPCLVCGLAPGNGAGITVIPLRLVRYSSGAGGAPRRMTSVAVGLCAECLADLHVTARERLLAGLRAERASA